MVQRNLKPISPEGRLPRGRAYPAHSACISTRTDWHPRSTPCVVYGKAGHGNELHGNHDAGQVCIDAYGERLIVDLGSPSGYPADFFGENRYVYYNASVTGHNILTIGNREMRRTSKDRAEILNAMFDDVKGGYWRLDLTPLYDGVQSVSRTVAFLAPNIVAVLDSAECDVEEEIVLRWHTISPVTPDDDGHFFVEGDKTAIVGRIVRLDDGPIYFTQEHHTYHAPYNRFRLGDELEQRHEPFIQATLHDRSCRLLTLFAVYLNHQSMGHWEVTSDGWTVQTANGAAMVKLTGGVLHLKNAQDAWHIPVDE